MIVTGAMAAEDDIDIDDIASSLLLDDDRLASIFQLALDDDEEDGGVQGGTAEPFQQQQATKFTASERAAPAPPAPQSIQSLPTPSTTVAEERPDAARMPESSLPMEQRQQPMNAGPAPGQQQPYRWIPPFPGWRWGMPLPPGYPPPPMPPQWMHQQMQMQMSSSSNSNSSSSSSRKAKAMRAKNTDIQALDGVKPAGWGSGAGAGPS